MALDGITLYAIINELNKEIIGGKIDKIYQPEKDEIILTIRNKGKNLKLLISANANYPRMYLTNETKENPIEPPMFCMLLRKFLQGGKIIRVNQLDFDRIVEIDIESRDEFENQVIKTLIVEIMGRHSNIILVDKSSSIIIDSIKRVYPDMSKIREILPGKQYVYPPTQSKLNLIDFSKEHFINAISLCSEKKVERALVDVMQGFSPSLGREISFRANIYDKYISELSEAEIDILYKNIKIISEMIKNLNFEPCLAFYNNEIADFSCVKLKQYDKIIIFESICEAAYKFFNEKANRENIQARSYDLKKVIQNHLDKLYNKLNKQEEEINEAKNADLYRLYGELITANMHLLKKGMSDFKTINYYTNEEIIIPLNKKYSPSENAQSYFKKYSKAKKAVNMLQKQIDETINEIKYLEGQLVNIEQCALPAEIEEIRSELSEQGYIRIKTKKVKPKRDVSQPVHIVSSDGYDIYIGKNNVQNDFLTLKFAGPNDIWLHTKDIPGSHVIIKSKDKSVPETTLYEAARLAASYSKAKSSSNVPVDYTFKKYVKKPSGAKPGFVIYTNQKTLYVTP